MRIVRKIGLSVIMLFIFLFIGLIINNRIFYMKYNAADTKGDTLSKEEMNHVYEVFQYLHQEGNGVFNGFNGKGLNLILYNEAYEFLFCDFEPSHQEWVYIGKDENINKLIFRRAAVDSQAFAVKIDASWAGSFPTINTFHKQIISEIPVFYPPQLMAADEQYYKAMVIHEMLHAYQGIQNSVRIDNAEHIHKVSSSYYTDDHFNTLIEQEAEYLQAACQEEDIDKVKSYARKFLQTRGQRREECQMSMKEIYEEQEMEWLEGLARYAEYMASQGSTSFIAKNLLNISNKVKVKNDDRYYTLGMAEYIIILKIGRGYEEDIVKSELKLEEVLYKLCME